jgi:copper chaperone CopZ
MHTQIFKIEGMTCKNCKTHVENGIKMIEGVEEVDADNVTGLVKITGESIHEDQIRSAVEKSGYRYIGADKPAVPGSDIWFS